ncbi:MAG: T9SS type A sorting domain-containing protein [Melioribacteraceae bacterium]|nr:T9SS type A sorting domain-containing protein [Melioribacteraceae bacterium]
MMKKLSVFLFVLLLVPTLINAQERAILRANGELIKGSLSEALIDGNEVRAIDKTQMQAAKDFFMDHNDLTDTDVILFYEFPTSGLSNFGQFGQDRMIQWFEAPADMTIRRAGVNTYENPDLAPASLKLVKFAWTKDQILPVGVTRLGWYEAAGNGFNDITAYMDDPDVTGGWVDFEGNAPTSPFAEDLWSDGGFGAPFVPLETGTGFVNAYEWFDMNLLFEPEVLQGDIIGVSVKNESADMGQVNDRIGFLAYNRLGIPGFKFYANGRLVIGGVGVGDPGWWSREFTWDFALDVTLTGDQAPTISDVTPLRTTVDQGDRTVSATIVDLNPSGGPAGVDAANLMYSINGGDYMAVAMTNTEGDTYEAAIPGQAPATEVSYYVEATDVEGNTSETLPQTYSIFLPTEGVNALIISNGWGDSGYPVAYYFGARNASGDFQFDNGMDVWAYGPVETALLDNYDYVYEFFNGGGLDYHKDAVRTWLAAKEGRGYFLAGMEWLGAINGYVDVDYVAGDFEYDVLGIAHSYNDITYDGAGQDLPSNVFPVEGTPFGDALLENIAEGQQLQADPVYEVGLNNWMDAFDAADKAGQVQITVETRGIGGATDVQILPAGIINEPAGNKVVFLTFDPITLNTDPDGDHGDNYTWHGYEEYNFPFQAALWFGQDFVSDVRELETIPTKFELSQNYPNPFNPSTTIRFQVPQNESVSLKVFDVLGREVATLLNDNLSAGSYEVNFDASNLAAGMYVYRLQAGDFVSAKKMMLLK